MATELSEMTRDILVTRRQYFIDKVKGPMIKALVLLANRFQEPTRENTKKKISLALLDVWDEFFKFENNPGRDSLFRAIKRISVSICESDSYYSQRITWFLKKLTEKYASGEWPALESFCPSECWTDETTQEAVVEEKKRVMRGLHFGKILSIET